MGKHSLPTDAASDTDTVTLALTLRQVQLLEWMAAGHFRDGLVGTPQHREIRELLTLLRAAQPPTEPVTVP